MDQSLPLFPLTTALVPGLVLPLHIFEPRYRMMVEELLGKPEDEREFGIVALRESHTLTPKQSSPGDVPDDDASPIDPSAEDAELYPVGVSAVIRQAERGDDGRYDIVTIGSRRFRLEHVDRTAPLLRASVTLSSRARSRFRRSAGGVCGPVGDAGLRHLPLHFGAVG